MRMSGFAGTVALLSTLAISGCGGGDDGGGPVAPTGPPTITLSPTSTAMTFIGQARAFRATVRDADGQTVNTQVSWTSSDAAVFAVDGAGTVTAVANGSGQLQASALGVNATASVTVEQRPTLLVVLSGGDQEGTAGSTLPNPVVVQVADQGGTGVSGVVVSFAPGEGAGSASPQNAVSDAGGQASTEWTLGGGSFGNQSLRVSIEQGAQSFVSARAVPETPIPDLAIEGGLRLGRSDLTSLEEVELNLSVANLGNAATPVLVPFALLVNDAVVSTHGFSQLGVDERVDITLALGTFDAGNHTIQVVLDPDNEIEEWTEDNNAASVTADVAQQAIIAVEGTGEVWSRELSVDSADALLFRLDVGETVNEVLSVRLTGGTGDADLFLHYGQRPEDQFDYRCFSVTPTTAEICQSSPTRAGSYHVAVHAYTNFGPTTMTITVGDEPVVDLPRFHGRFVSGVDGV